MIDITMIINFYYLLLCFLSFCSAISSSLSASSCPRTPFAFYYDKCLLNGDSSVIIKDTTGRLGNHMFAYKLLLSLQLRLDFRPMISRRTHQQLAEMFANISIPVAEDCVQDFRHFHQKFLRNIKRLKMDRLEELIHQKVGQSIELKRDEQGRIVLTEEQARDPRLKHVSDLVHSTDMSDLKELELPELWTSSISWELFHKSPVDILAESHYRRNRALILYPLHFTPTMNESQFIDNVPGLAEELEASFQMHATFTDLAAATVQSATQNFLENEQKKIKKWKKAKKKRISLVFVGIHCRRGDHLSLQRTLGKIELRPSYFLQAMDMYREHYKRVLFLFISDDLQWGRRHLGNRNGMQDLFFVSLQSNNDTLNKGHDLAVMSLCNHTILSYGTFSYWAGFLAGGNVILPYHFHEYRRHATDIRLYADHPLHKPLQRLYPMS